VTNAQPHVGGKTIVFVPHVPASVRALFDRVRVLEHGRLMFDGSADAGLAAHQRLTTGPAPVVRPPSHEPS
jgi:ABC-type multidrug transport system ATPase subunit